MLGSLAKSRAGRLGRATAHWALEQYLAAHCSSSILRRSIAFTPCSRATTRSRRVRKAYTRSATGCSGRSAPADLARRASEMPQVRVRE